MAAEFLNPTRRLRRRCEIFFQSRGEHLGTGGRLESVGLHQKLVNLGRRLEIEPVGNQKIREQDPALLGRINSHGFAQAGFRTRGIAAHRREFGFQNGSLHGFRSGTQSLHQPIRHLPLFQSTSQARVIFDIRRGEGPGGRKFFISSQRRQILAGRDLDFCQEAERVRICGIAFEGFRGDRPRLSRLARPKQIQSLDGQAVAPPF